MQPCHDIRDWIDRLRDNSKLIIVEGIKDKAALSKVGIGEVWQLKQPLYKEVEEIAAKYKEVIILTDLDAEGRKLYGRLKKDLTRHGVKVDNFFREWLFKNTKLRQIEGLVTYIENHTT